MWHAHIHMAQRWVNIPNGKIHNLHALLLLPFYMQQMRLSKCFFSVQFGCSSVLLYEINSRVLKRKRMRRFEWIIFLIKKRLQCFKFPKRTWSHGNRCIRRNNTEFTLIICEWLEREKNPLSHTHTITRTRTHTEREYKREKANGNERDK